MIKALGMLLVTMVVIALVGCSASNERQVVKPSLAGISLGDSKEMVQEKLGEAYAVTTHEEAGHFPENFSIWDYGDGTSVCIGEDSGEVLEIKSTAQGVETNLGTRVGDTAESVFGTYRGDYAEPESIHGFGILTGVFKVEEGATVIFDFDVQDGIVNPEGVDAGKTVERIILTYPAHIDEDF